MKETNIETASKTIADVLLSASQVFKLRCKLKIESAPSDNLQNLQMLPFQERSYL